MSMDLAIFSSNIETQAILNRLQSNLQVESIPPNVMPKRGMSYVDIYIKAFYFPVEVSCRKVLHCMILFYCLVMCTLKPFQCTYLLLCSPVQL